MVSYNKKGQSLPLNTVIIAILVILVLVIIIVYFTTSMSKTGSSINDNTDGVNACKVGSYLISEENYDSVKIEDETSKCSNIGKDWTRIIGAKTEKGKICCAKKISTTTTTTSDTTAKTS